MAHDRQEHRGWEISQQYSQHVLDDPDYEFTDDAEGSAGSVWLLLVLLVCASLGIYAVNTYLTAPPVVFPPPTMPTAQVNQDVVVGPFTLSHGQISLTPGWQINCIHLDGTSKLMEPNYGAPICWKGKHP